MTETLEWWPDYDGGPLWQASGRGGQRADSGALGLPVDLAARLAAWNQRYAEDKLPVTGVGDPECLEQGVRLLAEVRRCLAGRFDVAVSEPWWGGGTARWTAAWPALMAVLNAGPQRDQCGDAVSIKSSKDKRPKRSPAFITIMEFG